MRRVYLLLVIGLCIATVFLGCLALIWLAAEAFTPPMDYVVVAEFRELPQSDDDLKHWLLSQPGVYIGFVERHGNSVTLVWGHVTNRFSDAVTPKVQDEFERFGYKGLVSYQESKDYRDK